MFIPKSIPFCLKFCLYVEIKLFMVLHIILRHFKGKIVVYSRCQLLISINVSSKIKIHLFNFFIYFLFVYIDQFL